MTPIPDLFRSTPPDPCGLFSKCVDRMNTLAASRYESIVSASGVFTARTPSRSSPPSFRAASTNAGSRCT